MSDARRPPTTCVQTILRVSLVLCTATGCSTNRFRLANDRRSDRDGYDAAIAGAYQRQPRAQAYGPALGAPVYGVSSDDGAGRSEPTLGPPQSAGPPPPPLASADPLIPERRVAPYAESTPAIAAAPTASPRPGPPGTELRRASNGPELSGRVLNPNQRPEPYAAVRIREAAPPNSPVAEVASDSDGVFRVQHLDAGQEYVVEAASQNGSTRLVGRSRATVPDANIAVQLRPDNDPGGGGPAVSVGNRPSRNAGGLGTPDPLTAAGSAVPFWPGPSGAPRSSVAEPPRDELPPTPRRPRSMADVDEIEPPQRGIAPLAGRTAQDRTPESRPAIERGAIGRPPSLPPLDAERGDPRRGTPVPRSEAGGPERRSPGDRERAPPPGDADAARDATPSARREAPGAEAPVVAAQKVPAFAGTALAGMTVTSLKGQMLQLGDINDELVVIDFFATWCGPCRQLVPSLNQMHRDYARRGVKVLGVACENGSPAQALGKVKDVADQEDIEYGVVVIAAEGSPLKAQLGVKEYPTLVVLDRSGRVLAKASGATPATIAQVRAALDRALADRRR